MPHLQTRKRRRQNEIIHMSVLQLVSSWRFIKLEPIIYGICIGCGSALSDYITSNLERYALKRNKSTKPAASKAFWSISNIKVANTVPPNIISFFLMQRSQKQTNKRKTKSNTQFWNWTTESTHYIPVDIRTIQKISMFNLDDNCRIVIQRPMTTQPQLLAKFIPWKWSK